MATEPERNPLDAPIVCIIGRRGSGKTTLCRQLVEKERRLIAWDVYREHKVAWTEDVRVLFRHAMKEKRFRIGIDSGDTHDAITILEASKHIQNVAVVIEEVDLVATATSVPVPFRKAIAQGRHWGLTLYTTSRRPAEVSRLLTSQAYHLYCFQTHEPRDIAYMRGILGEDAERLITLPKFHCLHWTPDTPIREEIVRWEKHPKREKNLDPIDDSDIIAVSDEPLLFQNGTEEADAII